MMNRVLQAKEPLPGPVDPNEPIFVGSDVPDTYHHLQEVFSETAYDHNSLWQDDEQPDGQKVLNEFLTVGQVRWLIFKTQTNKGRRMFRDAKFAPKTSRAKIAINQWELFAQLEEHSLEEMDDLIEKTRLPEKKIALLTIFDNCQIRGNSHLGL